VRHIAAFDAGRGASRVRFALVANCAVLGHQEDVECVGCAPTAPLARFID